ncbi:alkaline phosphatase family protein [Desulfosediminicola sp.]|uniref:alkaline phosphatase family protein n=1 Tax=Desulfosediminicola sp. TaxID=2886825 RepID=UPI003AF2F169
MILPKIRLITLLSSFLACSFCCGTAPAVQQQPRLVLQITIDGLRGDMPLRFMDALPPGGFRYFYENGIWFTNAYYQHSNTETIVGHATLATGAQPAEHGMIGNIWLDRESGQLHYNIEDAEYSVVGDKSFIDKKTEIDPTQRAARSEGRSARAIPCSTFSDELLLASAGQAKVFAVSVKDRGAVPLAGHGGKAFWFNKKSGEFISSTYYYDAYPGWVKSWNNEYKADKLLNTSWELSQPQARYMQADADDRSFEIDIKGFGRTFPHNYGDDRKYFYTFLTLSPVGDELTLDFVQTLIEQEQIGRDQVCDYLAVSFSSTDYVSHIFGPASLESEDNLYRLDRTLAALITEVDKVIGLDKTLIVLSADHGNPEAPEVMAQLGMQTRRMSPERVSTDEIMAGLQQKFGLGKELIELYYHPYIYLNHQVIADKGLDRQEVEFTIAEEMTKIPGIAAALSSSALQRQRFINSRFDQLVRNNFYQGRSGDIYIIQQPYHHLVSEETTPLAAMHGSPYNYDLFVPVVFAGNGIKAKTVSRLIHPVDIARTLANCLHIKPPSSADGSVLKEVCEENISD